jgi:hypothetical protein
MAAWNLLIKVTRASWNDRLLLAEAVVTLAGAALSIRFLSFKTVVQAAGRGCSSRTAFDAEAEIARLLWAVRATAPRMPWSNVCFQRGLALHVMLRRRDISSILHYGVGRTTNASLSAHVWVIVDGKVIEGMEGISGHVPLVSFPKADA